MWIKQPGRPGLLLLGLVLLRTVAFAQAGPRSAPPIEEAFAVKCASDSTCVELAAHGQAALGAGRYDDAIVDYQAAYNRIPDPLLLYNLARAHHKAGRPAEAATNYERYLTEGTQEPLEQRVKAEQFLRQARQELAARKPPEPPRPLTVAPTGLTSDPAAIAPIGAAAGLVTKVDKPVYKRWWLWTLLGTAAATGISIGVGLGVYAREPDFSGATRVTPFSNP